MTYFNSAFQSQPSFLAGNQTGISGTNTFLMRIGQREICVCRDFRKRFYPTNALIECRAGNKAGHLEVLLFRRWLVIFSQAQS